MKGLANEGRRIRLAFVVSHPIQYYVPLYQRLANREEVEIRVFYTWHGGGEAILDRGFGRPVAWDIPLTEGYEFEVVPDTARHPGTHHFLGLQNPSLLSQLLTWRPDVVHVTGWAWWSHLRILAQLHRLDVPVLFRGDSHLLDDSLRGPRWWAKRTLLRRVFSWPTSFLYVGQANRRYYQAFCVGESRLKYCPHSIDVARFAEPSEQYEREAAEWRRSLGIAEETHVLLFAGKFEPKKQPLELMRAVCALSDDRLLVVLAGGGDLQDDVNRVAAEAPGRFRILPFQNQSKMPVVYRLGDLFVLPSAFGESWGLAVNEALACGRAVLVSDRVGCASDVVDESCGAIFPWNDSEAMTATALRLTTDPARLRELHSGAAVRARKFDLSLTEEAVVEASLRAGRAR